MRRALGLLGAGGEAVKSRRRDGGCQESSLLSPFPLAAGWLRGICAIGTKCWAFSFFSFFFSFYFFPFFNLYLAS